MHALRTGEGASSKNGYQTGVGSASRGGVEVREKERPKGCDRPSRFFVVEERLLAMLVVGSKVLGCCTPVRCLLLCVRITCKLCYSVLFLLRLPACLLPSLCLFAGPPLCFFLSPCFSFSPFSLQIYHRERPPPTRDTPRFHT